MQELFRLVSQIAQDINSSETKAPDDKEVLSKLREGCVLLRRNPLDLDKVTSVREKKIFLLEIANKELESLNVGEQDDITIRNYYRCRCNLFYLLWKLTPDFENSTAERYGRKFIEFSKLLEVKAAEIIDTNTKNLQVDEQTLQKTHAQCRKEIEVSTLIIRDSYLPRAEISVWLGQYNMGDIEKIVTDTYRAKLFIELYKNAAAGIKLNDLQEKQFKIVIDALKHSEAIIQDKIGETEALALFRWNFVDDIQSQSDKVASQFTEANYKRVECAQTMESFRAIYLEARSVAAAPHKGGGTAASNKRYYEKHGIKKILELFVSMDNQQIKIKAFIRARELFNLVEGMKKQEEILEKIAAEINAIKIRFNMEASGLQPLNATDKGALRAALDDEELASDFEYRLRRSARYLEIIQDNRESLKLIIVGATSDIERSYHDYFYISFERLFSACKNIASELLSHTHEGTGSKLESVLGLISGPLKAIPVAGEALSTVVETVGKAAQVVDYNRTINIIRIFDDFFAGDTLKYLAEYLACALVKTHYHQLPHILAAEETKLAKAKRLVLNELQPTVFTCVAEFFCSRVFGIIMSSEKLEAFLAKARQGTKFKGFQIDFIHEVGDIFLEELSHYEKPGIMDRFNASLLDTYKVRWQTIDNIQSLHDIFGKGHVITDTNEVFKHAKCGDAAALVRFGFIQSSLPKALARRTSLEDITTQQPPLNTPPWKVFSPEYQPTEISFPSLFAEIRRLREDNARLAHNAAENRPAQSPRGH